MERSVSEIFRDGKRVAAVGLATVALSGFAEQAQAKPDYAKRGTETEALSQETAANPYKIAEQLIFQMNNRPQAGHPNVAYGGALVFEGGTFVNNGPVAALERSKKPMPGTYRLKKDQAVVVQFPRIAHYGGRDWAIGYMNDGSQVGSAIKVRRMKWFDLKTANYDTYGYPAQENPSSFVPPKMLHVHMDPDANLQLLDSFKTIDMAMPPILQLMSKIPAKYVKPQLDYIGLQDLHDQYRPRLG